MSKADMKIDLNWDEIIEDEASIRMKNKSKKQSGNQKKSQDSHEKKNSTTQIDISYVNEVNYSSKPGEINIRILYSTDEDIELKYGENVKKVNQESLQLAREILERIK